MLTGGGGGGKASLTLAKNVRFSRLCIGIIIDLTQQVSTHHVSKNIKIRITSAVWCLDNHLLNPVILYQRVKCCISEYAAILRGALSPGCEALIKEHISCETAPFVRNDGTRDTSRDVTTVRGFPIRGVQQISET